MIDSWSKATLILILVIGVGSATHRYAVGGSIQELLLGKGKAPGFTLVLSGFGATNPQLA